MQIIKGINKLQFKYYKMKSIFLFLAFAFIAINCKSLSFLDTFGTAQDINAQQLVNAMVSGYKEMMSSLEIEGKLIDEIKYLMENTKVRVLKGVSEKDFMKTISHFNIPKKYYDKVAAIIEEVESASEGLWTGFELFFNIEALNTKYVGLYINHHENEQKYDIIESDPSPIPIFEEDLMTIIKTKISDNRIVNEKEVEIQRPETAFPDELNFIITLFRFGSYRLIAMKFGVKLDLPKALQ